MYRRYSPSEPPQPNGSQRSSVNSYVNPSRSASSGFDRASPRRADMQSASPTGNSRKHPPQSKSTVRPSPVSVRENNFKRRTAKKPRDILKGFLPPSLYDPKSKKIFGLLSSEDLLLIALIFLFTERDDEDGSIILALLYILLSDYIDLPLNF